MAGERGTARAQKLYRRCSACRRRSGRAKNRIKPFFNFSFRQWPLFDDPSGTLGTIVEHVLGFGLVFASNIAQRFANAVIHIFLKEFDRLDAPFLGAERGLHPVLDAWLSHRESLACHAPERGHNQARLLTAAFYTDDLFSLVLGTARAVRAKEAWFAVTRTLNWQFPPLAQFGLFSPIWANSDMGFYSQFGSFRKSSTRFKLPGHQKVRISGSLPEKTPCPELPRCLQTVLTQVRRFAPFGRFS